MTGNWMATVMEDHRGASARHVGLAMSGFWAGVTVGRLALARLSVPPRRLLVLASTATLVTVALLGVVPVGVALVGLSVVGLTVRPCSRRSCRRPPTGSGDAAGRVSGWQLLSGNGSLIVMTFARGLAVSVWGEGVPYLVVLGLAAGAAVLCRVAARLPPASAATRRASATGASPAIRPRCASSPGCGSACLALPEVEERLSHGSPGLVRAGQEDVRRCSLDDHHGTPWRSGARRRPERRHELVDTEPERFFVPPYVGHSRLARRAPRP